MADTRVKKSLMLISTLTLTTGFLVSSGSKESTCNAGDTGEAGSTPGSGRSPGGKQQPSRLLAWRTPWREGPGGLQSTGSQSQTPTERRNHHQPFSGSHSVGPDSLRPLLCHPMDCSLAGFCPSNAPGKTGVSWHSPLQRNFPTRNWTWVSCVAGQFFTI